ncbi:MAG: peptide-methionine (R)-S-oxide reductase MsrB [Candidatus Baltobacteraceae bacterium]
MKTDAEWREQLGRARYHILREAGTEPPFSGSLLEERGPGMFACAACGENLFASEAKFDSHCGWPSFTHPDQQQRVNLIDDNSLGMHRVEVRCKACNSHLGHVFDDGPAPRRTRYCINSLSLTFKPSPVSS